MMGYIPVTTAPYLTPTSPILITFNNTKPTECVPLHGREQVHPRTFRTAFHASFYSNVNL